MDSRPDLPRFYKPMRDPLPPEFYGGSDSSAFPETHPLHDAPVSYDPAGEIRGNSRVKEEPRREIHPAYEKDRAGDFSVSEQTDRVPCADPTDCRR